MIIYSFGYPDKSPEIVVNAPRALASTSQWRGFGKWHSYAVIVPNKNTKYEVFWGYDSAEQNSPVEAGVNVLVNGKNVATVTCSKNIIQEIEGIDLKNLD